MDEADLIKDGQRGDAVAFNRLVLAYQDLVFNVCYRMLGNGDAAADATQDAFLAAFQALKGFRGGSFKGWLLRIASNECYDQMRRRKRQPTTSLEDALDDGETATRFASSEPGPEEHALRGELVAYVEKGLARVPSDQRIVVILSDVHGLSYEEIAQATNANIGTVKSRLSRGRAHLRDFLRQHGELLPAPWRHDDRGEQA